MSASRALQKALIARLKADAGVAAFVGARIYDQAPADAAFPFISLGPSSVVPADAECIRAREETIQFDIWSRDNGLLHPCRAISDAVYDALHQTTLALDSPYANLEVNITLMQTFLDADGLTAHGVLQVAAMVETV